MKDWRAVRRNSDGSVDDVAISCDVMRIESLDDNCFWVAASRIGSEGGQAMFTISWDKKQKRLVCVQYSDTIGTFDDTVEAS